MTTHCQPTRLGARPAVQCYLHSPFCIHGSIPATAGFLMRPLMLKLSRPPRVREGCRVDVPPSKWRPIPTGSGQAMSRSRT